jgi:peptidoglycan hydrolase FlgJ
MAIDINSNNHFDQARNALDLNGLNAIRQQSRESDGDAKKAALTEAAQQFEAIFMKMLLSSMRKAQEVLESNSPFNSQSTKFYRDMHDQQMAVELSSNGSLGLTDLIVRQLGGDSDHFKPSTILRNDGNLAVNLNGNSSDAESQNGKATAIDQQHSLTEKRVVAISNTLPDINVPINGQYQSVLTASNPLAMTTTPLIIKTQNNDKAAIDMSSLQNLQSFSNPKDFVSALIGPAQKVQQTLGLPFQVVIAQAALETGWGQKIIKDQQGSSSHNLFNIKADSRWTGDKVTKDTLEFEQGAMVKKAEPFRMYQSLSDSVDDYINFLSKNDRYQGALQNVNDVEQFLHSLQKAGYATDPQYAEKILRTLKTVTNFIDK